MLSFTVDVEDWYNGFFDEPADFERFPSRIDIGANRILGLLSDAGRSATFFFLGCIARRNADLVRRVAAEGHELALHGEYHHPLWRLDAGRFREQLRRSRSGLEDCAGQAVRGFRAPLFSVDQRTLWALDVLEEEGFGYDSSIFPIWNPRYGFPSAPTLPFRLRLGGQLVEVPISTWSIGPLMLPFCGGFYLRTLPLAVVRSGFRRLRDRNLPGVLYVHPWELDPRQPEMPIGPLSRLRHRTGLRKTAYRLELLLREFEFGTIGGMVEELETTGRILPARSLTGRRAARTSHTG